ncbi:hypothetical protein HII36_02755 [Nonomuraea sp. NN258]|uniref:hypothetical protein n=1 Tax=Nonomuraea antri TaxID=2730852 RepID=UPI00156A0087|nr:hypothetical protein [Nonomuraea antri]NRQ30759.1 hypothetical protein [Nonomuraea antri]
MSAMQGAALLVGWFAAGGEPGRTPLRSLGLLAALTVPVLVTAADLDVLMRATSACLAAVTAVGVLAAVRALPAGRQRGTAVVAGALSVVALACCGAYLLVPAALAVVALVVSLVVARLGTRRGFGGRGL